MLHIVFNCALIIQFLFQIFFFRRKTIIWFFPITLHRFFPFSYCYVFFSVMIAASNMVNWCYPILQSPLCIRTSCKSLLKSQTLHFLCTRLWMRGIHMLPSLGRRCGWMGWATHPYSLFPSESPRSRKLLNWLWSASPQRLERKGTLLFVRCVICWTNFEAVLINHDWTLL